MRRQIRDLLIFIAVIVFEFVIAYQIYKAYTSPYSSYYYGPDVLSFIAVTFAAYFIWKAIEAGYITGKSHLKLVNRYSIFAFGVYVAFAALSVHGNSLKENPDRLVLPLVEIFGAVQLVLYLIAYKLTERRHPQAENVPGQERFKEEREEKSSSLSKERARLLRAAEFEKDFGLDLEAKSGLDALDKREHLERIKDILKEHFEAYLRSAQALIAKDKTLAETQKTEELLRAIGLYSLQLLFLKTREKDLENMPVSQEEIEAFLKDNGCEALLEERAALDGWLEERKRQCFGGETISPQSEAKEDSLQKKCLFLALEIFAPIFE